MATANPKTTPEETEEELRLEAVLKSKADEKKAIFETTRETDERLRKVREEEEEARKRLHHLRADKVEMDQLRRRVTYLEEEKRTAQSELKAVKTESDQLKQQVAVLTKREHDKKALAVEQGCASEEIEKLRRKNSEQNQSLEKLIENLQRTTSYSRTQQKQKRDKEEEIQKLTQRIKYLEDEKEQREQDKLQFVDSGEGELQAELKVLRIRDEQQNNSLSELNVNLQRITSLSRAQQVTIKSLEDKITAGQQMGVETQLRQLNELHSLTEEIRQLKQTLTTQHQQQQQQQQQQQLATEEHHQDHADLLRALYKEISATVDAQSVARNMFQCNALTLKELQSIQCKYSESVKAAEQLLDIVMKQSGNVYSCFLESLKATGHQHVYENIIAGSYRDFDDRFVHTQVIRQYYVFLVDTLVAKYSGLVGELYQAEVLSREEMESINSEVTSIIQNEKLLSVLSRKTKDQFDKFLDALDKTGQQHVRNHITGRQQEEIQQTRTVSDVQDVSVSHQLQQQLQQANETMEKLLQQPKPSLQSQTAPQLDLSALAGQEIQVRAGYPLNIDVPISGTPTPTVTWKKDGKPLKDSPRVQQKSDKGRAQVHISVAEREDTGKYTLTVSNPFGVDNGEVSVVVLGLLTQEPTLVKSINLDSELNDT